MTAINRYLPVVFVILAAFALQVAFIFSDCKDTPARAAVAFTKAYYRVDPAMADFLCRKQLKIDGRDLVEKYVRRVEKEARDRGFGLNYLKNTVYHIETYTRMIDDNTAAVRMHANRRTAINPVFALIGKFFLIGETHKIDETIPLVKEDGKWKVCGKIFDLPEA